MKIFEKLAGPLTVYRLITAHRVMHGLTAKELESKLKLRGKKIFTLKEVVKIAKSLGEDQRYFAQVWFQEEARRAGLGDFDY